ncbi:hypothetical protein VNO77_03023 [Canavalia gladiata]|uniref:Secreted protein n=1 Tax=Canavalia gladiata TaxID=3824 RepID=A0AAN9MU14_CANGL
MCRRLLSVSSRISLILAMAPNLQGGSVTCGCSLICRRRTKNSEGYLCTVPQILGVSIMVDLLHPRDVSFVNKALRSVNPVPFPLHSTDQSYDSQLRKKQRRVIPLSPYH